ncbi:MAG: hypothetical protein K2K20_13535 [Lachnospiraceae bacterium]|nr:hypothetical protein [Lachnospiraceae bacterium]
MDSMDNMKDCPQCGGKVLSTAKFCGDCGYRFPAEETVQSPVEKDSINEIKIPAPPKIESFVAPAQPAGSGLGASTPEQPVNNDLGASTPEQPVNNDLGASTPEQPVNSGLGASTPVQPASGSYSAPTYTQPSYPPYSPVQPPQKKGKGGLIALFSILGVLVLAGTVLAAGFFGGWFQKKEIVLSETKVTVVMEEEVTIEVENYKDLGKPELTATVQEGKEDLIEVEVKGDEIIVTGIEEGKNITVTISAKGCEDASFKVTVEEPEEVVEIELSGTAWDAEGFKYYFLENGTMYMISEEQENYIKGTYTVTSLTQEKAENYVGGENPFNSVSDGVYFLVEVDVEQELYYGNEYEEDDYYLVVCTNGKKCEIYDSSWDYVAVGSSATMESESDLDSYFEMASSGGGGSNPSGSITSGSVQGINFGRAVNVKETWHIAEYASNNGDILIFKKDGNLWGINEDGGNAVQLTSLGEGLQVTIFAVYEDYLFYGVGQKEEGGEAVFYAETDAFYKVDLMNDDITMLSDDIEIKDFVIYNDTIYYTDYSTLFKMDFDGNMETLYDYGVFTFEVTDDYIFIFDGYAWEAIDPEDGTDYGYLVITDGEYEADVVRHEDEMLFFTVYNYDDGDIYLYAMDYDGNTTQIGDAYWGESWDTYNVAFDDKYVIYTVNGGEVIVKTDITSGAYETVSLSDYDYYYVSGMVQCGDDIYLYARDYNGDAYFLELDADDLSVEEIPGVTAQ